jgi:hypothetical protein
VGSIIDGGSHPRALARNTGLSILGHLPSNDLIRLQFESSIGICVPNLVPDGLHQARQWPQVEDGGPDWRIPPGPHEVSSGGHRLHEAGRGGLTGRGSLDQRCLADWQKLTAIRRAAKSAVKISIEFKHQKRWHRSSLTPFATRKRDESHVTSGARGLPQATQRR